MRKFKLLLISVLFPCMCMGEGAYHEDNEFIIRAGFTGSHLRYKDNIGGTVNVSYIPFEINSCCQNQESVEESGTYCTGFSSPARNDYSGDGG